MAVMEEVLTLSFGPAHPEKIQPGWRPRQTFLVLASNDTVGRYFQPVQNCCPVESEMNTYSSELRNQWNGHCILLSQTASESHWCCRGNALTNPGLYPYLVRPRRHLDMKRWIGSAWQERVIAGTVNLFLVTGASFSCEPGIKPKSIWIWTGIKNGSWFQLGVLNKEELKTQHKKRQTAQNSQEVVSTRTREKE